MDFKILCWELLIAHKEDSLIQLVTSFWRNRSPMAQKHAPKQTTATLFKQTKPIVLLNEQKWFRLMHLAELLGSSFDFCHVVLGLPVRDWLRVTWPLTYLGSCSLNRNTNSFIFHPYTAKMTGRQFLVPLWNFILKSLAILIIWRIHSTL